MTTRDGGRLLVIVPDSLTALIAKGEITPNYYNPGEVFDEVHLLLTNDDDPPLDELQRTVGRASLAVHNLPPRERMLKRTLGYRPFMLRRWAAPGVELAARLRPRLVRCHGVWLNAFVAREIQRRLGIPYVVSLHINPDEDVRSRAQGWKQRVDARALSRVERLALRDAALVLPVYRAIVPYLERLGVTRYEVAYNMLNPAHLTAKEDYALHRPVRVISTGRQFAEKNPEQLIASIAELPEVELTLVGDGPLHDRLRHVAARHGVTERVVFERAVPNDELCRRLPSYDIFATHSEYWEISKSVLEPLVTGLPVVINRRRGEPVPELTPDICLLVDNSADGYRDALAALIHDDARREQLGRQARTRSVEQWAPETSERHFADIYRRLAAPAPFAA